MPRGLALNPHVPVDALAHRYRACRDPVERTPWQIVWLVAQGHTCPAVARLTGDSETWVRTIIHRYHADGPTGITDRRHANPGQPPLAPPAVRADLREVLATPPPDGGRWTGPKVAAWLNARLDRPVSPHRAWEVLQRIGVSLHQPRPRATAADSAAQEAFKTGAAGGRQSRSDGPSRRNRDALGRGRAPPRLDSGESGRRAERGRPRRATGTIKGGTRMGWCGRPRGRAGGACGRPRGRAGGACGRR